MATSASAASTVSGAAAPLTSSIGTGATTDSLTPRTTRASKQYACTHCSYSADKKVSLNRHMRMHQASPALSHGAATSGNVAAAALGNVLAPNLIGGAAAAHLLEESSSQVSRLLVQIKIQFKFI